MASSLTWITTLRSNRISPKADVTHAATHAADLVLPDRPELAVLQVPPGLRGPLGLKGPRERRVLKVPRGCKVLKASQDLLDPPGPLGLPELQDLPGLLGLLEPLGLPEPPELQDLPEPQEPRGLPEPQEQLELPVRLGLPVRQERLVRQERPVRQERQEPSVPAAQRSIWQPINPSAVGAGSGLEPPPLHPNLQEAVWSCR